MADILSTIISIVVGIIILAPVLWIAGRALVGKEKAKFTDAILIVVIGTVANAIVGYFLSGWIASIIMLIVVLALIKHYFDCGWLKALLVAIVTVVIFVIIGVVLALLGIAVFSLI